MNHIFPSFPFPLPLCLDGATGTELIKAGMPSGVCPEQWILSHPNEILQIQKRYADAGAQAILAPTFGANRAVLKRYGLEDQVAEMNRALAKLTRLAAPNIKIGGDLSPTGKYLKPIGDTDADELIAIYEEQANALEPYVDFFMIETNMDLACARMAVIGTKRASKKPIFVTLTVASNGKTMSGDDIKASFLTLSALGIDAFGLNCSTGPREMAALLAPLTELSFSLGIPLIAKPNAGVPQPDGSHIHMDANEFATLCAEMIKGGVPILGGCCGTDSSHIRALSAGLSDCTQLPQYKTSCSPRMIANARTVVSLPEELPEPIAADDDFQDNADDMAEDEGFVYVRVENNEDVDTVLDAAPFLSAPLAACGDESALHRLSLYFCGKITF